MFYQVQCLTVSKAEAKQRKDTGGNMHKHDITKLDPIHQKMYQEFISSEYTPNEVPDELYDTYLKLSKIPKKDWNKPSTKDKLDAIK